MNKAKPTSKQRAAVLIRAAFEAIDEAGGTLPLRDVKRAVAERVSLTEYDLARYEKTGYIRWESVLHFYSIDCVKAGFLRKSGGRWQLTPEGKEAMKLPPEEMLDKAMRLYRKWKAAQPDKNDEASPHAHDDLTENDVEDVERSFVLEAAEGDARAEIEEHVKSLSPYEFQDLVGALLRGMGYSTPIEASPGPDGGTDILAYPDPIGAKSPHIRVQVKHRAKHKATREEIAALRGIIRQDREMGLFVSSSGFTSDALREARSGTAHIELMDLDRFLDQWMAHYGNLSEEDKARLRLRSVYFLAPE